MRLLLLCLVVPAVACSSVVVFEDDGGAGAVGDSSTPICEQRYDALAGVFAKCTNCHSSDVTGAERNAAPIDANFETYEGAQAYRAKIKQRVEDGTMPLVGYSGLSKTERKELLEWTECSGPL